MATQVTNTKLVGEDITMEFDFLSRMGTGESVATSVVNVSVFAGIDAVPTAMISGASTVSNNVVSQLIVDGTAGVIYTVTVAVRTNLNNIYINEAKLAVLPDNSLVPAALP